MFHYLLLNSDNLGPEVRFTSDIVTDYIQAESEEIGEAKERNHTANVSQEWNAAKNRTPAPPFLIPQIFRLI